MGQAETLHTDRVVALTVMAEVSEENFEAEVFKGRMPFLLTNQQRQSIEGIVVVVVVVVVVVFVAVAVAAAAMAAVAAAAALVFTSF